MKELFLNFGMVFLTVVRMMKLRKGHCSPPLVGQDNSMVFTSHWVPCPAIHDLVSLVLEMAARKRQEPFHFLHTNDGKQILIIVQTLISNCPNRSDEYSSPHLIIFRLINFGSLQVFQPFRNLTTFSSILNYILKYNMKN